MVVTTADAVISELHATATQGLHTFAVETWVHCAAADTDWSQVFLEAVSTVRRLVDRSRSATQRCLDFVATRSDGMPTITESYDEGGYVKFAYRMLAASGVTAVGRATDQADQVDLLAGELGGLLWRTPRKDWPGIQKELCLSIGRSTRVD